MRDHRIGGIPNPFILHRADPWVYRHGDGFYYFTATLPSYDAIELRRSPTLAGLAGEEPKILWRKRDRGELGCHIWAPEIHFIKGKWYIYFAGGDSEDVWNIRKYVLENPSPNPLEGEWTGKGSISTGDTTFTLDATTFELGGRRYLVWAQKPLSRPEVSNLYIGEMAAPWTLKGEPVLLSEPEYDWETRLFSVNEGPAVLTRKGTVYLTYSASGTDHNYCMGLLTAPVESDLLCRSSWSKSPVPVFKSSEENGIYGPGHSCFTQSEDGETDILIYHARNYKEITGDPLEDINRHTRMQRIFWDDGTGLPLFGDPIPEGGQPL